MTSHAIDLPEMKQHIARHLDRATLKACSLVCRAWHLNFYPVLWDRFTYNKVPEGLLESPEEYATWLDFTSKNAHLFRHIYGENIRKPMPLEIRDILLDRCDGLITIEVSIVYGRESDPVRYWEEILRPLIERNKASLRRLQLLEEVSIPLTSLQLPSLLAGLSRLQSLDLGMAFATEYLLPVLDACSTSLERLELCSDILRNMANQEDLAVDQPSSPPQSIIQQEATTAPSLRLKHLGIAACHDGTLWDILSHLVGHSLESLVVNTITYSRFSPQVSPTLGDALSRLTDLHINNLQSNYTSDILVLLKAIPPHQLCRVYLAMLDTECAVMLSLQHHQSLESLGVIFLRGHSGALADIMATCHKLKTLDFGGEPLTDIRTLIDPQRPWVCTELEVLQGYFGLSPSLIPNKNHGTGDMMKEDGEQVTSDQVENIFMQRLGQLTKLRRLMQDCDLMRYLCNSPNDNDKNIMAWALSSGLRHLADLVNLEWLEFYDLDLPAGIGIPELVFIKQNWSSLKGLSCYNMDAVEIQEWLASEWPELEVKLEHGC
ncbi:MAG: hypothetical protein J3Q66DRAFT_386493 [Benniella sp.]|nr:MAG: hypothetical protein J3Q66DRAFT_386493 [Benniella sp.]